MVRWWTEFISEVDSRWDRKRLRRMAWFFIALGAISIAFWPGDGLPWWEILLTLIPIVLWFAMLRSLGEWPFKSKSEPPAAR